MNREDATYTNREIAQSLRLWNEYFNRDAAMSDEEFEAMPIEQRIALLDYAFGKDPEKAKRVYIIPQKMSGTGSIHDLASEHYDRVIKFAPGCRFAVVLAAYYGGKGYTTHKTINAAIRQAMKLKGFDYQIIDLDRIEQEYGVR